MHPTTWQLHGAGGADGLDPLALNARNCWVQQMVRAVYFGWYDGFVTKLPLLLEGDVTIPDGAGLGLQLQPDVATRPGASVRRTTAEDL